MIEQRLSVCLELGRSSQSFIFKFLEFSAVCGDKRSLSRCGYKAQWWKKLWPADVLSRIDGYSSGNVVPEMDLNYTFAKEETLISKDNKSTTSVQLSFSYFIAPLKLPYRSKQIYPFGGFCGEGWWKKKKGKKANQ